MALIISGGGNTIFRSEEIICVSHLFETKTNELSSFIGIVFKSGKNIEIDCDTVENAKEFKDKIIEILKQEY